jgi:hypothetical protein
MKESWIPFTAGVCLGHSTLITFPPMKATFIGVVAVGDGPWAPVSRNGPASPGPPGAIRNRAACTEQLTRGGRLSRVRMLGRDRAEAPAKASAKSETFT